MLGLVLRSVLRLRVLRSVLRSVLRLELRLVLLCEDQAYAEATHPLSCMYSSARKISAI